MACVDPTEGGGTKTVLRSSTMPNARPRERAAPLSFARAMALPAMVKMTASALP